MNRLLVALLIAAGPARPQATRPGEAAMWEVLGRFDEFPGASPYAVADQLEARGAKLQAAGFNTEEAPEKVLAFYRKEFEREGLFVIPLPESGQSFLGISAFDPASGLEKTVAVMAGHGGRTQAVLSVARGDALLAAGRSAAVGQDDGLPVFPGATPFRSDALDGARHTTTVTYQVKAQAEAVLAYLRPALAGQGWTEEAPGQNPGPTLRLRRGAEGLEVLTVDSPTAPGLAEVTTLHQW